MSASDAARVFLIGGPHADESLTADLVGGKAVNLVRLSRLGLTVPPALGLPTALCREYMRRGTLPDDFPARLAASMRQLEDATGLTLGGRRPLLVSVRSSPPMSMPGMLGTILNVGLTEDGVRGLIRRTGNPWLAWEVYYRFVRSVARTARNGSSAVLDRTTAEHLTRAGVDALQDLDAISLRDLARSCAALLPTIIGKPLPCDPLGQITWAVEAVLQSWSSPPAHEYRRLNRLDDATGIGVLIQAMVFGNSGPRSGSGVGFTRNPATGDPEMYVDFAFNAQGEDVVSGRLPVLDSALLPTVLPDVWTELQAARTALEREFRDMQDFEFTVQEGQLFFVQTRPGKRTPWAALRIATDLVGERIIDSASALERLAAYDLDAMARVVLRPGPGDLPLGYHQPPVYYLPSFTLADDWGTHTERGGRFRLHEKTLKDKGEWSWQQNPFVGMRPYQGLLVILMMFNSSDLKNANNTLYEQRSGDVVEPWYVVRDLGTALGDTGRLAPTRSNPDVFARQPFIVGVRDGFVEFEYHGWHQDLVQRRITPDDVGWASYLLSQLGDRQWRDAFRAAGYTPAVADRFIGTLAARIAKGRQVGGDDWP